jgi:hypothetical protein
MLKPLIVGHKFNLSIDLFNSEKIKYRVSTISEIATCETERDSYFSNPKRRKL